MQAAVAEQEVSNLVDTVVMMEHTAPDVYEEEILELRFLIHKLSQHYAEPE